jgi:hypothetical protein
LAAENLFLRKQLALFQERQVRPHLATDAARWLLVFLGKFFEWRRALVLVKPETLLASRSSCGRAVIPKRGAVRIPILFRGRRRRALRLSQDQRYHLTFISRYLLASRSAVNAGYTRLRCINLGGFDPLSHMYAVETEHFRACRCVPHY